MPIKSIKNKLTNIASGEILGEADRERESIEMAPSSKGVKKKREKNIEPQNRKKGINEKKSNKSELFKRKESRSLDVNKNKKELTNESIIREKSIKGSIEGYQDVLSILDIKEQLNIDVDFQSEDMDYIQFSQTTPLGFDFDEVTDFISRTKYTLNKLESALKQRDREIVIVASEVKKVEQKMIEKNQERELAKMIGDMTEEERLIAENIDLKIEINELKGKLLNVGPIKNSQVNATQFEALKAENEMLKESIQQQNVTEKSKTVMPSLNNFNKITSEEKLRNNDLPSVNKNDSKHNLPKVDNVLKIPKFLNVYESEKHEEIDLSNNDAVDDMIRDMGGLYEDE